MDALKPKAHGRTIHIDIDNKAIIEESGIGKKKSYYLSSSIIITIK